MIYSLCILIADESTLTLVLLADALNKAFANSPLIEVKLVHRTERSWDKNPAVVVHDREIEYEWTITTSECEDPMDPDERAEILENVADHPDYQKITSCKCSFYVESEKDYDLDYLDIYATVVETLQEFPGVYVFDSDLKLFPPMP
ncbi:MAG: hypothetical protein JWL77_6338 [Chthonomonadaceae bacterium]|nr:hypothetical protein [Chthonomonadaceae bacterium]